MEKGMIIYKSKYGATKKYAEWLSDLVGYESVELSQVKIKDMAQYKNIVFCGAIYASGISGLSFFKKHFNEFKNKNFAIFCVGASPYDEKAFQAIKEYNLSGVLSNIPLFYGRGAWDESKMKFIDKTLCKMLEKVVSKKDPSTYEPWEIALVQALGKTCDWTDAKYLQPLVNLIENWN